MDIFAVVTSIAALVMTPEQSTAAVLKDVFDERQSQDKQWGGPDHDDCHLEVDWVSYIVRQLGMASEYDVAPEVFQTRMVKVAALAVAAVESSRRRDQ